ncbi:MAG: TPM domain-containing protein [Gemmatimonadales bacterium]|nr:TPM domain-containing protein [Gemmatimonadales bacterium]
MTAARRKATGARGALQLGLALLLALLPVPAAAQDALTRLFPARPAGFVTDVASVLGASADALESRLGRLRDSTGAEVAVVTLPTLGDYEPEQVALAIGRAWGVGAKAGVGDATRNAGLVLLVVPKSAASGGRGRLRIEVGQGLEGIVTDARASRVRDAMRPQLAAGDYAGGVATGVDLLARLIEAELNPDGTRRAGAGAGDAPPRWVVLLFVAIVLLALLVAASSGRGGGPPMATTRRRRGGLVIGPTWGGGFGGGGGWSVGGGGGGGFGGFGGGGGFSGGGSGGDF